MIHPHAAHEIGIRWLLRLNPLHDRERGLVLRERRGPVALREQRGADLLVDLREFLLCAGLRGVLRRHRIYDGERRAVLRERLPDLER